MRILGISRSPRFSPNSTARDAAIFGAVAAELRESGHEVDAVCEDEYRTSEGYDLVFNMGRDVAFLRLLAREEAEGRSVVNSAQALLRNTRAALSVLFEGNSLPVACNVRVNCGGALPEMIRKQPCWLKRGDACAQSVSDVRLVASDEELAAALDDFTARGITEALLSEHITGDLVKFYGVEGTDFFHLYYPTAEAAFSKFGLEKHNGAPQGFEFDRLALKKDADRAACLSRFIVYGGDCVVRPDGTYLIIDFNDWPSFSRCCGEAARAIAWRLAAEIG